MKALLYESFQGEIKSVDLPTPSVSDHGVIIKVTATGLCRSDWHGWMGHDPDISLPHVPGHELAGTIHEVGKAVKNFVAGQRVTVPFVCGCGACPQCDSGNQQVCDYQTQPGFTHWGSFAEYVAIENADLNLVALPDTISDVEAAALGCRFITSYRAIVDQAKVAYDQYVAVFGCGGVGLSAIMIAKAKGAHVIAVDINHEALELAKNIGADFIINANEEDPVQTIKKLVKGGVHISIDALGSQQTCFDSISSLRKRGKHIQIGLMTGDHIHPKIPMDLVIANELEIIGSHGMQAHRYTEMFSLIDQKNITLHHLISREVSLDEAAILLTDMNQFKHSGMIVITSF